MQQISRNKFLSQSARVGALLTVPQIIGDCHSGSTRNVPDQKLDSPILKAIAEGVTAPNSHNTQPWKFLIQGPLQALLYVDETRTLPETDPYSRQILISQGTFLEHLDIGARQMSYKAEIDFFPHGVHVQNDIGSRPVAQISLIRSTDTMPELELYPAIAHRSTNRAEYDGPMITQREFADLQSLTGEGNSTRIILNTAEQMRPYHALFLNAMAIECRTERLYEETRHWFRFDDNEIESRRDGLSLKGNGMGVIMRTLAGFFLNRSRESWHDPDNISSYLNTFKDTLESSKAYVFFKTESNEPRDWIQVGRDYARFQLACTARGLVMQPLSQIIQEYPEMDALRSRFESKTDTTGTNKIQMIARLGRSNYEYLSPRRPVTDMLIEPKS